MKNNYKLTKFFLLISTILLFFLIIDAATWHKSIKQEESEELKQRIVIPIDKIINE